MKLGESDRRHRLWGDRGAGQRVWCLAVAVGVWAGATGAWASPGAGLVGPSVLSGGAPIPSAEVVRFGVPGDGVELGEGYGAGGGAVGMPASGPAVAPVPAALVGGAGLLAALAVRRRRRQRDWTVESLS